MAVTINASTSAGLVQTADTSGVLQLQTNSGTTAVTIDTSQNVGIGTTSPAAIASGHTVVDISAASGKSANIYLHGNGTSGTSAGLQIQSSTGDCGIYQANNLPMVFATNNAERMRITAAGDLLVGATSATVGANNGTVIYGAADAGIIYMFRASGSTDQFRFYVNNTNIGKITTTASATSYVTSSDYRLKENIVPMIGALDKVLQLKPVTYKWKADGSDGQGFIAHELQAVVPDCVTGEKDAVETYTDEEGNEQTRIKPQGIDTSFLVATLTAAIQEQQTIINDLKARITALEGAK
jgi:hypothetical protein